MNVASPRRHRISIRRIRRIGGNTWGKQFGLRLYNVHGGFIVSLLDLFFPKRCVGCKKVGCYLCSWCRRTCIPIAPNECICPVCGKLAIDGATHPSCQSRYSLDGLTSFFYYRDAVRSFIRVLKYQFVTDTAETFITLIPLSSYIISSLMGAEHVILVPIPLHPNRQKQRGFNQSALVGQLLAKKLKIPIDDTLLHRVVYTTSQVEMRSREARRKNIPPQAFQVAPIPENTIILLFDDVFTTGATMRSAGNALKWAGAKMVWGVTMAR